MQVRATIEASEAEVSYTQTVQYTNSRFGLMRLVTYPYEGPRRLDIIVVQVPDEVAHDRANDQAGHELEASYDVEWHSGVVAWSRLRFAVERVEHLGRRGASAQCYDKVKTRRRPSEGGEKGR